MQYGDYVVYKSQYRGVTPLQGIRNASTGTVTYAKGCERWSSDESGFPEAVAAAQGADVAVVVVGTCKLSPFLSLFLPSLPFQTPSIIPIQPLPPPSPNTNVINPQGPATNKNSGKA